MTATEQDRAQKAQRQLARAERDVDRTETERGRLKWFLLLAVTTWPLGFIWNGWIAIYIATSWLTFWAVGAYLNYWHRSSAKSKLDIARRENAQAAAGAGVVVET